MKIKLPNKLLMFHNTNGGVDMFPITIYDEEDRIASSAPNPSWLNRCEDMTKTFPEHLVDTEYVNAYDVLDWEDNG